MGCGARSSEVPGSANAAAWKLARSAGPVFLPSVRSLSLAMMVGVALALMLHAEPVNAAPEATPTEAIEHFETHVRPLLVERCSGCHGADRQWAGLRLDSRDAVLKGGESGPAVVPGNASESELLRRITHADQEQRMPPAKSGARLTAAQIAAIRQWIDAGAPWPANAPDAGASQREAQQQHWAFQPVQRPALPAVKNSRWVKTPVDHFILHKLEAHSLAPSPAVDRRTLIRRATYDLLGLPPSAAEVEAFERDPSPDAYERLIERLLDSPHYGEQWGRHWLDVARYSDTKGYVYAREEKTFVHAHAYRDWVVHAFNSDLPYDRFLLLQIAADQVAADDPAALAAMGFLTLGRRFLGVTPDIIDDRIDVVSRGTMGLTVSCARCHDHKYDPIPTADYYALYGVFDNCVERLVPLPRPAGVTEPSEEYLKELESRKKKLTETFALRRTETSARVRERIGDYLFAQSELDKYPQQGFDQVLSKRDLIPQTVWRWHDFLVSEEKRGNPVFLPWRAFSSLESAAFAERAAEVARQLASMPDIPARLRSAFADPPASLREVADRYGQVFAGIDQEWNRFCEAATKENRPLPTALTDAEDEELRQVLYRPDSPCVIPDEPIVNTEALFDSATVTELWKLQGEVDRWLLQSPEAVPHATILTDRQVLAEPRIFHRGNPANRGETVPRQFLLAIAGAERRPFTTGSGRLELAQAIASPENPLTARVWVNRVWLHHFGAGLVRTPSDFGLRAESPSHPELLDWLAGEFIRNGWSTKWLHRQIMLSATWQQRSDGPDDSSLRQRAVQLDPENRLLWRMNARRLSFEEFRDTLVALTGELDPRIGGRPVEHFPAKAVRFRRSIYGRIDRQFVPAVMRIFDFANPDLHSPQRSETTVPQQALFALNHPFIANRARTIAEQIQAQSELSDQERVTLLYRTLFQRRPDDQQLDAALSYLESAKVAPPAEQPRPETLAWSYGYGELDESSGKLKSFQLLPHFNGSAWQGGPNWPDAALGWVQLTAQGGHAGNNLQHAAIRRWTAPHDGRIRIRSRAIHDVAAGDGIRCWIVSGRRGILQSVTLHNSTKQLDLEPFPVEAGETIDFIVDYNANLNSDQFLWAPTIEQVETPDGDSATEQQPTTWSAERDFVGPLPKFLDPWAELAQVMLLSNELMFVD